jgi:hypothetical protein
MRDMLIVMISSLVSGCAGIPDRVNSFSAKAGPHCPAGQVAVVERRMMDDRYDCVDPGFIEQSEMVNYDEDR